MSLKRCQLGWTSRGDLLLDQMGFSWNFIPNNTTEVWGKKTLESAGCNRCPQEWTNCTSHEEGVA